MVAMDRGVCPVSRDELRSHGPNLVINLLIYPGALAMLQPRFYLANATLRNLGRRSISSRLIQIPVHTIFCTIPCIAFPQSLEFAGGKHVQKFSPDNLSRAKFRYVCR